MVSLIEKGGKGKEQLQVFGLDTVGVPFMGIRNTEDRNKNPDVKVTTSQKQLCFQVKVVTLMII